MRVKDLIRELKKCDKEMEVFVEDNEAGSVKATLLYISKHTVDNNNASWLGNIHAIYLDSGIPFDFGGDSVNDVLIDEN